MSELIQTPIVKAPKIWLPFRKRIQSWIESRVLTEIDVRKLKLTKPEYFNSKTKAARLKTELTALSDRLVILRNLVLDFDSQKDVQSIQPVNQNASEANCETHFVASEP